VPKRSIANVKRDTVERVEIGVPSAGLALRGKNRQYGGSDDREKRPWDAIAEGADQLGQINFRNFLGSADDAQTFTLAAKTYRDQRADEDRHEGGQPHDPENRDLGSNDGIKDAAIAQRREPQEINNEIIEDAEQNQPDDDQRRQSKDDYPRSHPGLVTARDLPDVFAHHVGRTQPNK